MQRSSVLLNEKFDGKILFSEAGSSGEEKGEGAPLSNLSKYSQYICEVNGFNNAVRAEQKAL
ncbi:MULTISPECIES: hypothetical protein [Aliiglaciecola]|uniref:hypothetical protein n=1 Tax=Aliiglaciecola TaxID=1406885 RepID=UPI001C0A2375|nr:MULTISPECIES: hypothetical protein [Aliiglaciecola]MBU2877913.1 hypothetical protein [Aliiglaciecola lipolytica]MDO6709277.1 hypothetical protein [Aliiglaciecola sp. 2_MG-2023]MDO6750425.1 hypothetical protein [Aliiglaciecola sp. 1_MG-2023]